MTLQLERCKNMVLGALVADAAAMGLHWIYDQPHILKVAPERPEFRDPDRHSYEGVPAFFAHPDRKAGAFSQYGEQTMVMLRALDASGGQYEQAEFTRQFSQHFGYGGAYVGYIDHATRGTLDNMRRFEDAAFACAAALPFEGDPKVPKSLTTKALPLMMRYTGTDLHHEFQDILSGEAPEVMAYADRLLAALETLTPATGACDLQLPAIAKLPALVALLTAQGIAPGQELDAIICAAVRSTNDHPVALEYGQISAHMMVGAAAEGTVAGAISAGRAAANGKAAERLDEAIALSQQDTCTTARHFGMACDLPFGVPAATHNIATATSFTDAVRQNIYSGGDSCGRAILVGAVMGAVHGVGGSQGIPQDWIDRLEQKGDVTRMLDTLFDQR